MPGRVVLASNAVSLADRFRMLRKSSKNALRRGSHCIALHAIAVTHADVQHDWIAVAARRRTIGMTTVTKNARLYSAIHLISVTSPLRSAMSL